MNEYLMSCVEIHGPSSIGFRTQHLPLLELLQETIWMWVTLFIEFMRGQINFRGCEILMGFLSLRLWSPLSLVESILQ